MAGPVGSVSTSTASATPGDAPDAPVASSPAETASDDTLALRPTAGRALTGPAVQLTPPGLPPPTATSAAPPAVPATTSAWWSDPGKKRTLTINGYDFDFKPESVSDEEVRGEVDGPLTCNGKYTVTTNHAGLFAMSMQVAGMGKDLSISVVLQSTASGHTATVSYVNGKADDDDPGRSLNKKIPLRLVGQRWQFEFHVPTREDRAVGDKVTVKW